MPIKVTCNSCSGVLHAPDDAAGKRGRCPTCGMILTIPADAPRVPAEPVPAAVPLPATPYGFAPEPAIPRPPAIGDEAKASFGSRPSVVPPLAGRLTEPRGDVFAKTQKRATFDPVPQWMRVCRGLGLECTGVVLFTLGIIVPSILAIIEQYGVKLPEKDPGLLGVATLDQASEIKLATAMVLIVLGALCVLFGRFAVAGAPVNSGARGVALASALAWLVACAGFVTVVGIAASSTFDNHPPHLIPGQAVLEKNLSLMSRFHRYFEQTLLPPDSTLGQTERFALLAFIVAGLISSLWMQGAVARMAAHLRDLPAIGRVNRLAILFGLLFLIAAFIWLVRSLYGDDDIAGRWENLDRRTQIVSRAGGTAFCVLFLAFCYIRSLTGVRRAIRETANI